MRTTRIFLLLFVVFAGLKMARPAYALRYCRNCDCSTPCSTKCVLDSGQIGHCSDSGICLEACVN